MRRGQLSLLALAAAGAHALAGHSVLEQESPKPIDPSPIAPGAMRTHAWTRLPELSGVPGESASAREER